MFDKNNRTLLLKIVNNDQDLYLESSEATCWRGHDWKFLASLLVHMVDGYILLEHVYMVTSTALQYRVNHHIYHFSVGWGIGSKILWEKLGWYVISLANESPEIQMMWTRYVFLWEPSISNIHLVTFKKLSWWQ